MGLSEDDVEAHAPSSTWRFKLMQKLIALGKDPDTAVGVWAEVGAPMGISEEIESGGWFPATESSADLTIEELTVLDYSKKNHSSFNEKHGEASPPAEKLVQDHVNNSFGILFKDRAAAERYMGSKMLPCPSG